MTFDLHLGSCLDPQSGLASLADGSIDVTITDPPYEAEAHTQQRRQKGKVTVVGREEYREVNETPLTFKPITAEEREQSALHIARVTRHCALIFCQVEAVTAWRDVLNASGMTYRRCIPWTKPDAMPSLHGRWPGQGFEAIVLATAHGARACPVGGKALTYSFTRAQGSSKANRKGATNETPHETTKPLRLMLAMVEHFTEPGDLVLDAFMGSGTTGVACKQLGRHFVGWELAACARCSVTAEWACSWIHGDSRARAYLCDGHRESSADLPGFRSHRDNTFKVAQRRLRGEEAKPRPEQPSLFGGLT